MRGRISLLLLLLLLAPASLWALDLDTRPVGPVRAWTAPDLENFDPAWLHLKFVEGSDAILSDGHFVDAGGRLLSSVETVLEGVASRRRATFPRDREILRSWKQRGELRSGKTGPDLSLWFDLRIEGGPAQLASVINALNAQPEVEIAHPAAHCEPAVILGDCDRAPVTRGRTPDFTDQQGYLYDPPVGLDAPAAWTQLGGTGTDMKFIDVELGWVLDHEDFTQLQLFYEGGATMDPYYYDHGTAVLGEVIGADNGYGVTGFAHSTQHGVVAITVGEWPDVPHYFLEAAEALSPGDVWLIELQMYPPGKTATPMEWLQVNFDAIWTSCWSLDVICVEAGANGTQDLDDPSWEGVFDRLVRDSGAIMVGAGTPTGRIAEWFTNWGSRMDVHAWGSEIVTTGYGNLHDGGSLQTEYTNNFGGTSGASPMIVGSALCLQGIAKAQQGAPLLPEALRLLLNITGVPHMDLIKEIGPRPDLGEAVAALLTGTAAPLDLSGDIRLAGLTSPFHGGTEIVFALPSPAGACLDVFDIAGRRVRSLVASGASAEQHFFWDGRDEAGAELGSGLYLYRFESTEGALSGKMLKLR